VEFTSDNKDAIVKHRTSFISGSAYPSTPNTRHWNRAISH